MKDKKAMISLYTSNWIFRAVFLAIMTVLVLFVVNYMTSAEVHAEHLRAESFAARVLYSPHGIGFTDQEGRFYPKTIDLEKFKSTNAVNPESPLLNELVNFGERKFIAAKLELKNLDTNKIICPFDIPAGTPCPTELDGIYFNHNKFGEWSLFSFDRSQFTKIDKQVYVLIRQGNNWQRGRLNIQVVTPLG
ncbi:MAG: hypothetical protein KJ601_01085 [Nanoarchaeota archaeon]|nr:hypothetical protein [Nanoarchaeota archaeon]MBU1704976.1 hypothetical protein [Nanoarchaeota archaeon]